MEFKRRTAERFRDGTGEQPAALRTKIAINTETFPSFRLLLRPAARRREIRTGKRNGLPALPSEKPPFTGVRTATRRPHPDREPPR